MLADELQTEIQRELDALINNPAVQGLIRRLNELGHNLREYYPACPGDAGYRDDESVDGKYRRLLRVGVDRVTPAGFADTREYRDDEFPEPRE